MHRLQPQQQDLHLLPQLYHPHHHRLNNRASPLLDNNIATIIIALISPCSNEEDLCVNGSSKTEEWYYQHSSWIHHAAREL